MGLLATSPTQGANDRAARLAADRPADAPCARRPRSARGAAKPVGRELSPALSLYARTSALDAGDREAAEQLLARPTDGTPGQPGGPYTAPSTEAANAYFCFHWVESGDDAPPGSDGNLGHDPAVHPGGRERLRRGHPARARRSGLDRADQRRCARRLHLGWQAGTDRRLSQGPRRAGLYGYAAPDPGQDTQHLYAFLVMDDDYAEYGYDDPAGPAEGHGRARVQPRGPVRLRRAPGQVDVRVDRHLDGGEGLPRGRRLPPVRRPVGAAERDADHALRPAGRLTRSTARRSSTAGWTTSTTSRSSAAPGSCRSTRACSRRAPTTRRSASTTVPASPTSWRASRPRPRSGRSRGRLSRRARSSSTSSAPT